MAPTFIDGSYSGVDIRVYAAINTEFMLDYNQKQIESSAQSIRDAAEIDAELAEYPDMGDFFLEDTQILNQTKDSILENIIVPPSIVYKELAEIQTLSYSVYRGKEGVRSLGNSGTNGFTRGYFTVAGTIIFTVLHERVLHEFLNLSPKDDLQRTDSSLFRIDQLPPLDIFVTFQNELGAKSRLSIYGVDFMNEGQVMSVQDLLTENSVNYVARHVSPLRRVTSNLPDSVDMKTGSIIWGSGLPEKEYDLAKKQIQAYQKRFL